MSLVRPPPYLVDTWGGRGVKVEISTDRSKKVPSYPPRPVRYDMVTDSGSTLTRDGVLRRNTIVLSIGKVIYVSRGEGGRGLTMTLPIETRRWGNDQGDSRLKVGPSGSVRLHKWKKRTFYGLSAFGVHTFVYPYWCRPPPSNPGRGVLEEIEGRGSLTRGVPRPSYLYIGVSWCGVRVSELLSD